MAEDQISVTELSSCGISEYSKLNFSAYFKIFTISMSVRIEWIFSRNLLVQHPKRDLGFHDIFLCRAMEKCEFIVERWKYPLKRRLKAKKKFFVIYYLWRHENHHLKRIFFSTAANRILYYIIFCAPKSRASCIILVSIFLLNYS